MSDAKTISLAQAFAPKTAVLPLRGVDFTLREVDLAGLLSSSKGDIPDFISGQVLASFSHKNGHRKATDVVIDKENLGELFQFVNLIVMAAVVSPTVCKARANYEQGQINVTDMSLEERLTIFNLVMPSEEVETALSFRQRVEAANLGDVPGGENNGNPPQRRTRPTKQLG